MDPFRELTPEEIAEYDFGEGTPDRVMTQEENFEELKLRLGPEKAEEIPRGGHYRPGDSSWLLGEK
jgi:hypothetical protein